MGRRAWLFLLCLFLFSGTYAAEPIPFWRYAGYTPHRTPEGACGDIPLQSGSFSHAVVYPSYAECYVIDSAGETNYLAYVNKIMLCQDASDPKTYLPLAQQCDEVCIAEDSDGGEIYSGDGRPPSAMCDGNMCLIQSAGVSVYLPGSNTFSGRYYRTGAVCDPYQSGPWFDDDGGDAGGEGGGGLPEEGNPADGAPGGDSHNSGPEGEGAGDCPSGTTFIDGKCVADGGGGAGGGWGGDGEGESVEEGDSPTPGHAGYTFYRPHSLDFYPGVDNTGTYYPDGISGIWNKHSVAFKQTAFIQSINQNFSLGVGGGSCPEWSFAVNLGGGMNYGVASLIVPCWVWDAVGLIILLSASFTARRIIFGG